MPASVTLRDAERRPRHANDAVIVTLLPTSHAARVGPALPRGCSMHRLESWTQLGQVRVVLPDAVVVDPLLCDPKGDLETTLGSIAATTSLVFYTNVAPAAMRRLMQLPALPGARLVLFGVDDGPDAFRATLRAARVSAFRRRALRELESRTGELPAPVARGLVELFAAGGGQLTVVELARAAHLSVRTLQRRLAEGNGPSPLWLIRAARALLARELLRSSALTVEEVSRQVGYAKLHSLRSLLRWSFDSSPSVLRGRRSTESHFCAAVSRGTTVGTAFHDTG